MDVAHMIDHLVLAGEALRTAAEATGPGAVDALQGFWIVDYADVTDEIGVAREGRVGALGVETDVGGAGGWVTAVRGKGGPGKGRRTVAAVVVVAVVLVVLDIGVDVDVAVVVGIVVDAGIDVDIDVQDILLDYGMTWLLSHPSRYRTFDGCDDGYVARSMCSIRVAVV
jgi:hypothetical protein